jgi:tRNA(Ile)-lysidine synthase
MQSDSIPSKIEASDLIPQGGHVVVGLSGGPDSLCLLHGLLSLSQRLRMTLSAVHVNHGFRPVAADEDQSFVENICRQWRVKLHCECLDVMKLAEELNQTPEEAGRTARYRAFDVAAREVALTVTGSVCIAVAHNMDDQAETILMRLLRGTGTLGLAGIPSLRVSEAGYPIIRPLLTVRRQEIEAYCQNHGLHPRKDHTNEETRYHRNSLRLELLPLLREKYNPSIMDALFRLGQIAAEDRDYFETAVSSTLGAMERDGSLRAEGVMKISVGLAQLRAVHPALRRRLILRIFARIRLKQDIEMVHLNTAEAIIKKGETGKVAEFPAGYRLRISYAEAVFEGREPGVGDLIGGQTDGGRIPAAFFLSLENLPTAGFAFAESHLPMKMEAERLCEMGGEEGRHVVSFDLDALREDVTALCLRPRRPGDRIYPAGMEGSRKIQDIFVDRKIAREKREKLLLLAAGDEILWIPGIRKSRSYAVTETTRHILRLRVMAEDMPD